ncbi:MAG: prepilin-type N-terminal cleavage/methylation domain-containing protein, partial [Pseudomonadota bacterium]|nr:prepilin-type N-terminal cleavage/methylation domain-containing protein [Pseudomonadota bacterium]
MTRGGEYRAGPEGGFTLVELLIALALIGLITLLLFSGLRLGSRAWEAVEATADRTAELRIVRNFLERALVQARAVEVTLDAEDRLVFSGDAENLELAAPLSESSAVAGLYILRLSLEEGRRRRLVLTRWLLHPDVLAGNDVVPEWQPFESGRSTIQAADPRDEDLAAVAFGTTVLLERVQDFQISYFGVRDRNTE